MIMVYALILACLILGIGFHVGQKVFELDKLYTDDKLKDVFVLLWKTDKVTILISIFLIIPFVLLVYLITHVYWLDTLLPGERTGFFTKYFDLIFFAASFVLGYAGQRLLYALLGKAVDYAENKVNENIK